MKESIETLADTVRQSKEIIAESSEDLFDAINQTKNDIPVVKWASAVLNVRDAFQTAKLRRNSVAFLKSLEGGDLDRAAEFFEKVDDPRSEYVEVLIDVLLTTNAGDASIVMGNLTAAAVNGELTYDELVELSHVVSSCSAYALRAIPKYFSDRAAEVKEKSVDSSAPAKAKAGYLVSTGLMDMNSVPQKPTDLAVKLYIFGFHGDTKVAEIAKKGKI